MVYRSVLSVQLLCIYYSIINAIHTFSILCNMSSQYYLVNDRLLKCAHYFGASINSKLVITDLFGLTEKMNILFRKGVVYVF